MNPSAIRIDPDKERKAADDDDDDDDDDNNNNNDDDASIDDHRDNNSRKDGWFNKLSFDRGVPANRANRSSTDNDVGREDKPTQKDDKKGRTIESTGRNWMVVFAMTVGVALVQMN